MNFVKHEELEKALQSYEKTGSLEKIAGKIDAGLRKFITESLDNIKMVLRSEQDSRITQLTQKFESIVRSSVDTAKSSNFKEMASYTRTQIEAQAKLILDDTLKIIDKKSQDIRFGLEQSITQKLIITQKEVDSTISVMKTDIYNQILTYQQYIENLCTTSIHKAVESHKGSIETMINDTLNTHYSKLKEDFSQMKAEIQLELNNKVVDKTYIEDKLLNMERELVAKTQENINFQIEQSRNMMEQSARAEINESLKQASSNLLKTLQ